MERKTVYAIVPGDAAARDAVAALRARGFDRDQISLLTRADDAKEIGRPPDRHLEVPQGLAVGAAVGGTLGWLAAVGAVTMAGVGPMLAAGPILVGLGGATVGAASGMVAGSFLGLGMSEIEARDYQEAAVRGDVVVAVHVESLAEEEGAMRVLVEHGADHVTAPDAKDDAAR